MNFLLQTSSIDDASETQSRINSVLGDNLPHTLESRYSLGDVIGTGGFSEVRLGVSNNALQQKVAVKIVTMRGMSHLDERALRNEVSILEKLKHPNIVRQLDFFHEQDKFYIILEYLDGGELFNRIVEKTCFNEKEARDCIRNVLKALKYCHDNNIVHRDLKPENLLLSSKDKELNADDLKLADFGFAVVAEGDNLTDLVGTPDYIAPEILSKKRYGKAVDMWSLGVVMYILLGGYAPFADELMPEQYRKIKRGYFEFHADYWRDVSGEAKDLISRLLVVDPSRRLTADQALQHPWMLRDTRELEKLNLDTSLTHLRKHLARRKFKGAVNAVITICKMKNLLRGRADSSSPSSSKELEVQNALKRTEAYLRCILGENLPHTFDARYTLEDTVLGSGGFSEVRSGVSKTALLQKVAVKIVDRKKLSPKDEESLQNEVAILDKLNHPHILRQLDFFEEPDHYYIVLECLSGGELFSRIVAKTYFNEKEARDCVKHVLKALKYCHDQNIVHRDLKPENLLLTSSDEDADLKLADFGFAVQAEGDTLTDQLGTPDYIAPDILSRKPYGKAVDMWSLGVVVFVLLGGYMPFSGATQAKLFRNIQLGVFEFHPAYWKDVSEEAKDLISSLIEVNPSRRLTADQALQHPWLTKDGQELEKLNLDANLSQLRKHLAIRKFKGVVKSVIAVNRMKRLLKSKNDSSGKEEQSAGKLKGANKNTRGDNLSFIIQETGTSNLQQTRIRSRKSRNSPNYDKDMIIWATYWMAFSALCAENFMGSLPHRIPFFYTAKIFFLLWLLNPMSKGALTIYDLFLKNMIAEKLMVRNIFLFGAEASILIGLVFPRYSLASVTYLTVEALEKCAHEKENFVRNLPERIPLYYPFKIAYMLWFMVPQFRVSLILIVWGVLSILMVAVGFEQTFFYPTTFVVCSSIVAILLCTFLVVLFSSIIYGKSKAAAESAAELPPDIADWSISNSYTLGKVLGAGFLFGKVLRMGVSKNALQQKVVIRMINRNMLFDFQEDAWQKVFTMLDKLRHPNIIRKIELFDEPDSFYLVLEYMSGGDLHQRVVEKTYLSEKEARRYVIQVLKALKYLHDNHIVHRDLRPENMMFTSTAIDADLKLVELSYATFTNGNDLTEFEETRLLTPHYIAPEILEKKNYGSAVDMWSLGVIVYTLLGGYPPFFDDNTEKLTKLITSGEWNFQPEYWGSVSLKAKDFISKLLENTPAKRMTAKQALDHPWLCSKVNSKAEKSQLGKQLAARKLKGVVNLVIAANR
eukprot:gene29899-39068_t